MTETIVIGGGIAGCSTAFAISQRGGTVTLIERGERLASAASGNPVAMLYPKLGNPADAVTQLGMQGFDFTKYLLEKLPASDPPLFALCGQLQLAHNAREQQRQHRLMAQIEMAAQARLVSTVEASELAGVALDYGGLYWPHAGWVKPADWCAALTQHPAIRVKTLTEALEIKPAGQRWQVQTTQGTLSADQVVICNAGDAARFAYCTNAPITAVRGQISLFAVNAASQQIRTIVCTDHFIAPSVDGVHTCGATYTPHDDTAEVRESDTRENLAALKKIAPSIYQTLDFNLVSGRVGWRSTAIDYLPLAGQMMDESALRRQTPRYNSPAANLPWLRGLYVNIAHGSKGMITAPICGELIANMIYGEPLCIAPSLASRLNPSRFALKALGLKRLAQALY